MNRRSLLATLALPALLAACDIDPVTDYLGGFSDPIRGAALFAPRNLGDTSRWQGDPAGAAMAAAQLEFLARSLRENANIAPTINPATTQSLDSAVLEMRAALGINPRAPNQVIETTLRAASQALRAGSEARALAILSGPDFEVPPAEVLRRLGNLPRLRLVAAAAGMAANDVDQRRRG